MNKYLKKIKQSSVYGLIQRKLKQINSFSKRKPFLSLFITLFLLLVVIIVNSSLSQPPKVNEDPEEIRKVVTYSIGETPRVALSAKVEESNVIDIYSQTAGVVKRILVEPGQEVFAGQQLFSFSSDYYGNSAPALQRQLAEVQYDNVVETYDIQKELIREQRNIAQLQKDNAEELRKIADSSLGETRDLLELNESLLSGIDLAISVATDSAEISSLQSQKAQLLSGINQIKSGLRQAELQADEDKPPFKLQNSSYDLTIKQLDLQEKSLAMSKEISHLQFKLARVQESLLYPGTPEAGVVERIHVQKNDVVNPGMKLATVKAKAGVSKLVVKVSKDMASQISSFEATTVEIGGELVEIYPDHISSVPTDGKLYSVVFTLPMDYQNTLSNGSSVMISVPVGTVDTNSVIPFLPLESVYQSELETTVFILADGEVQSLPVELGVVSGNFVEVRSGLENGDQIILDRNVIEGQKVVAE